MQALSRLCALLLLLAGLQLSALPAFADEDAVQVSYISLVPAIVGNYAAGGSKLKFYKADIALRVLTANKERVENHEPLIRDQLVMLFAQKSEEDFAGIEGKEAIRQEALKLIQAALLQEEGEPLVDDLLFNNLVVQS